LAADDHAPYRKSLPRVGPSYEYSAYLAFLGALIVR